VTTVQFDGSWLSGQGRLSPDDLQTATFPLSRLGRRGYEEEPVRAFLHVVHGEFTRLVTERTSLWQEVQRLRRRILAGQDPDDPRAVLFGEQDAHIHAVQILSTAQATADRYVADAQAYSSRVTDEARRRRDDILTQAQQHSQMILDDAGARARDAAVTALETPSPPQTDHQRQAAAAELAYLRTYTDVYRSHLRAYTEGILRGIEEWERKEQTTLHQPTTSQPTATQPPAAPPNEIPPGQNGYGGSNGHRSIGP
jgi:cell division septum initiation protein DivIVA